MLSVVVSWRDRLEIGEALPSMLEAARLVDGDVTIVNFSGDADLLQSRIDRHATSVRLVHVTGERYFNKSAAQNVGASHTNKPVLFFCDCDIVLEPASIQGILKQILESDGRFATLAGVRESQVNSRGGRNVVSFGYHLRIVTADGRRLEIIDNEEDSRDGTRQAPGLLMVRRDDFLAINGYNAGLHGWGWEDQDMISRLTLGLGLTRISTGTAIHLSHDDRARMSNYPMLDRWESRDRMFRRALANYDRGDFTGSYDRDVRERTVHQTALRDTDG